MWRRPLSRTVRDTMATCTGIDIDPTTSWTHDDSIVEGLGRPAVRCGGRQPTVPQPAGHLDVARRPIEVRRRTVCRQRGGVPGAGGSAGPARRTGGVGAAALDPVDPRCRPRSATTSRVARHCGGCGGRRPRCSMPTCDVWAGVWEVGATQGEVRRSFGPTFEPRAAIAMPTEMGRFDRRHRAR